MHPLLANLLVLIQHFAAFLATFGSNASTVAALALKVIGSLSPILTLTPIGPYLATAETALQMIVTHGAEIATDIDKVAALFNSVDSTVVAKLTPTTP